MPGVHIVIGLAMHQTTVTADTDISNPRPVSQTGVSNKAQRRHLPLNTLKLHLAPPMHPQRLQSTLQGLRILTRITATATQSARTDAAQSTEETAGYMTLHAHNT
jgi:hypothetical protein